MRTITLLAKYNTALSLYVTLAEAGTGNAKASPTLAAGDVKCSQDGAAEANLGTLPAFDATNTKQVNVTIASGELDTLRTRLLFSDQTTPKEWDDLEILIETYGHASAAHPNTGWLTGDPYARLGAPAGASVSADIAAVKAVDDAVKAKTDSLTFTVANQVDSNVVDWKGATAPAMTGDAYARLGAPAGASVSADVAAVKAVDDAIKAKTDNLPASPAAVGSNMGTVSSVTGNVGGNVTGSVGSVAAGGIAAASFAAGAIDASAIAADAIGSSELAASAANEIADALLDRADAIETGWTVRKVLRIFGAALGGKVSGGGTSTIVARDIADAKDRITATVDADGNRSAITLDGT